MFILFDSYRIILFILASYIYTYVQGEKDEEDCPSWTVWLLRIRWTLIWSNILLRASEDFVWILQKSNLFIRKKKKYNINPIWPRGGHIVPPPITYLRISVLVRVRAHWKNLTFLGYEFGKGQYTFYPLKLSCFAEKK